MRHDLRDAGASTTLDPEAPAYTLRDLAADAAALARALDDRPAHLAGVGVGGMVAQVAALDHPEAFAALTLRDPARRTRTGRRRPARPRRGGDGPAVLATDAGLVRPRRGGGARGRSAEILGDDPDAARARSALVWDRSSGTTPSVQLANQLGTVFSRIDCTPRWRERLPALAVPTLVVHGRDDRFLPVGNGEALAREIPGARLHVLEEGATATPDAAAEEIAAAMVRLDGAAERGPQPGPSGWARS